MTGRAAMMIRRPAMLPLFQGAIAARGRCRYGQGASSRPCDLLSLSLGRSLMWGV